MQVDVDVYICVYECVCMHVRACEIDLRCHTSGTTYHVFKFHFFVLFCILI